MTSIDYGQNMRDEFVGMDINQGPETRGKLSGERVQRFVLIVEVDLNEKWGIKWNKKETNFAIGTVDGLISGVTLEIEGKIVELGKGKAARLMHFIAKFG